MRSNKKERRKRKDKRKNGNKQRKKEKKKGKNRELVRQACTNRLFPPLPFKILPFAKSKEKGSSRH